MSRLNLSREASKAGLNTCLKRLTDSVISYDVGKGNQEKEDPTMEEIVNISASTTISEDPCANEPSSPPSLPSSEEDLETNERSTTLFL
ncbi:uncharacterized protein G2W53_032914 [Senna tora]|uniref:Uncharacterized protein n=1 Tax=Senna tora TaxID=362788 RepID=A0A834W829_9FABA|nr:uncharacterized protein G2W53_032914 [Senna tora]